MSLAGKSIDSLARQIAELAQALGKLEHAWLARIREFDRREGWAQTGCISMSAWLAWHTGISHKAASERVRVARALGELPLIDHAFESGELSYSKVRAITRIAEPAQQQALIDVAKSATASQLDKIVGGLRRVRAAATPEENIIRKVPRRHVRFETTEDGMVRMVAVIGPEEALMVQAAMRLAESPTEASADSTGATDSPTPSREESPAGDWGESQADALVAVARGYVERKPTTRGSGFELIMITTPEQLEHGPDGVGGILRDGTPVPLGIARALACDAKRVDVSVGESGEISMSDVRGEPSRVRSLGRSRCAMAAVACRAAGARATSRRIMLSRGRLVVRRRSTTSCCSAPRTTSRCMRAGCGSRSARERSSSATRRVSRSRLRRITTSTRARSLPGSMAQSRPATKPAIKTVSASTCTKSSTG